MHHPPPSNSPNLRRRRWSSGGSGGAASSSVDPGTQQKQRNARRFRHISSQFRGRIPKPSCYSARPSCLLRPLFPLIVQPTQLHGGAVKNVEWIRRRFFPTEYPMSIYLFICFIYLFGWGTVRAGKRLVGISFTFLCFSRAAVISPLVN